MPRDTKPPRLWFRKPRRSKPGRSAEKGVFVILCEGRQISTGCGRADSKAAEKKLRNFIDERHKVPRRKRDIEDIPIGDVLTLYLQERVPKLATARKAAGRFERLAEWWGDKYLSEVTRGTCEKYTATKTDGAARRELQDLQAAISYHHKESLHHETVRVTLPEPGEPRQRWLTEIEAEKLISVCQNTREIQAGRTTAKRPLLHLERFIIFGLRTGSRPGDILNASFYAEPGRGFIDLEAGLFYRKPVGKIATKKRQPITPLPSGLLTDLRRWKDSGARYVVEFDGQPVKSIKSAFNRLVALADLPSGIVPYTLRHTCATWLIQSGETVFNVAGYLGTSPQIVEKHYGHHCLKELRQTAEAATQRLPKDKAAVRRNKRTISNPM